MPATYQITLPEWALPITPKPGNEHIIGLQQIAIAAELKVREVKATINFELDGDKSNWPSDLRAANANLMEALDDLEIAQRKYSGEDAFGSRGRR